VADPFRPSRYHRDPVLASIRLTSHDLVLLRDLFFLRFAATPALVLSARWASGGAGGQYALKRLTMLWRAGLVERFAPVVSRYVHAGAPPFIYTLGTGKVTAAARTGIRPSDISEERWRVVLAEANPARLRAREALLATGIDGREIDRVLHNNTIAALRFIAGETSGVHHHVLAAAALSEIWFRARMAGQQIEDIQPDGVADLSFREPDPRAHRDLLAADGVSVPIRPDCLFTIAGTRYALEAETGSASAPKLLRKLRRYARLLAFHNLSLILVCSSAAHMDRMREVIRDVADGCLGAAIEFFSIDPQ